MSNQFRDALATIRGSSWPEQAARSSLLAAESKFAEVAPAPILKVELAGRQGLGVAETAAVSLAVQNATAKLGHIIRDPSHERTQARKSDRRDALLVSRAQFGSTMFFAFPDPSQEPEASAFPDLTVPTLAQAAAMELCAVLPGSSEDDAALDALVSQRTTVRSAVNDIVEAVTSISTGISLDLTIVGQEPIHSEVTVGQAEVLADSFRETRTDRREEQLIGRLDGVRTRRRIFYLELDTGGEVHGAIADSHLMDVIRENLDHRVLANVISERVETLSGRRGRATYRLVGLERAPELFS